MLRKATIFFRQNPGLILVTAVYLLTFLLMLPLRDQAFDDDFAYIQTTERLVKTGELKVSEWVAVPVVFQAYWGTLFAKIFGFSIKTLHVSNLFLLYMALISFYFLLKNLKLDEAKSTIFSLLLLGSPWVFQFAYTFMSDVFYMSLIIISLFFFIRGLKTNSALSYLFGSLFVAAAFLTRQFAVVILFSISLVLSYQSLVVRKILWKQFIFSLIPATLVLLPYLLWVTQVGPTEGQYRNLILSLKRDLLPHIWPFYLGHTGITNSLYIELFIQRGLAYFNALTIPMLPIFLIYSNQLSKIPKILKENKRPIFFTGLVLLAIYFIDRVYGAKFSGPLPYFILGHEPLVNWKTWWPILKWLSLPIWIVIIALTARKALVAFFADKPKPSLGKFRKLVLFIFLFGGLFFLRIAHDAYPLTYQHPARVFLGDIQINKFINSIVHTKNVIFSWRILELIKNSWFFMVVLLSILLTISYVLFRKTFKRNKELNLSLLFLGFVFILQAVNTIVFAHYYWDQYVIPFIPLAIIWVAYIFRNIKINLKLATVAIFVMLLWSLENTRNRYQEIGVRWELGTKLVESGVSPYNISEASWAWRPYWFFESTFAEATKKYDGDKHKVPTLTNWLWGTPKEGDLYEFYEVSPEFQLTDTADTVVLESEPFWTFFESKKIIVKKIKNVL